jgi:hypothetical protein
MQQQMPAMNDKPLREFFVRVWRESPLLAKLKFNSTPPSVLITLFRASAALSLATRVTLRGSVVRQMRQVKPRIGGARNSFNEPVTEAYGLVLSAVLVMHAWVRVS